MDFLLSIAVDKTSDTIPGESKTYTIEEVVNVSIGWIAWQGEIPPKDKPIVQAVLGHTTRIILICCKPVQKSKLMNTEILAYTVKDT